MKKLPHFKSPQNVFKTFVYLQLLITFLLLLALFIKLFSNMSDNWDVLAFCGSIIGGAITWAGVKLTIKEQKSKDKAEDLKSQIKALMPAVNELSFIAELSAYALIKSDESNETIRYKIVYIERFIVALNKILPDFIGVVDFSFVRIIELKQKKFSTFKFIADAIRAADAPEDGEKFSLRQRHTQEYLEEAQSIFFLIHEHKNKIIKEYYALKAKSQ